MKGEGVPSTELARYYGAADIVLNDHWDDMLAEGFISNRIYDALASGGSSSPTISPGSDRVRRLRCRPADRAQLGPLIDRYLADPDERRRRGTSGGNRTRAAYVRRRGRGCCGRSVEAQLLPIARICR